MIAPRPCRTSPNPTMPRLLLCRITAALLCMAACFGVALAQAPIVIHHIGPLTGVLAPSNKETLAGAELFLQELNAAGGVRGRPVKLELRDDGQDAKVSKATLDSLVEKREVLALLLPRTTPSMLAMLPSITAAGIPVVGPQTGGSFVNQPPLREVFTLRASYQREAEVSIRLKHALGVRSFAVLLADDVFGTDTYVAIERVFKELGITPVAVAKVDNRKPDVTEAVASIAAKAPQAVLLIVSSRAASGFVKAYRNALGSAGDPTRTSFISLSNTSNNDYLQGLAPYARGVVVMQVLPSPFSGATALAREYAAASAKGQAPLSYAGFYGYAAAKLLALGLSRAGATPTPASLVQALEGLGDVDLGGFRLSFGPGKRVGSSFVEATIVNAEGRFLR